MQGMRGEISSNFDGGETAQIYSIKYDPSTTIPYRPGAQMQADETAETGKPLKIYSYDFSVASTTLTQMYQSYYDDDDATLASNWNLSSNEFQLALKQNKLLAGNKARYDGGNLENLDYRVATIKFRAKWNKRSKDWDVPPITLSANKKNMVSWHVANVGATDNAHYYAFLRIRKWKQVV